MMAIKMQQRQTTGTLWARVERLKSGMWSLETYAPPFHIFISIMSVKEMFCSWPITFT